MFNCRAILVFAKPLLASRQLLDVTRSAKVFDHPDPEVIYACVIANATGVETKKMKAISDVKEQDLDRVNKSIFAIKPSAPTKPFFRSINPNSFALTA